MFVLQIVEKYDIILLQEIRDATETAIYELVDTLNRYSIKFLMTMYIAECNMHDVYVILGCFIT